MGLSNKPYMLFQARGSVVLCVRYLELIVVYVTDVSSALLHKVVVCGCDGCNKNASEVVDNLGNGVL
jgi:hypothetical protein